MATAILSSPPQKSVTTGTAQGDSMFDGWDRSKLIRESRVAEVLSLKVDTIRKWRATGKGPRFVRIGRNIYYRVRDLQEFIDEHLKVSND